MEPGSAPRSRAPPREERPKFLRATGLATGQQSALCRPKALMDDTPEEAYLQGGLSTAWDDEDFELGAMEQALPTEEEEEEAFVLPVAPMDSQEPSTGGPVEVDRPVLLLNLSGMAKQLGQDDSSVSELRSQVIDALSASFLLKSSELLVSGLCWHSVNWRCADDQQEIFEELEPGSVMTVIPYPEFIDGVPVDALWAGVCRPTAWEVIDLMKNFVANSHRDLRWKADVCKELEAMAERAMCLMESRQASSSKVASITSERQRVLDAIDAAEEACGCDGEVPEKVMRSMVAMLQNLDSHLVEATVALELIQEEGGPDAPEGEASGVDLLVGMIFQRLPRRAGVSGADDLLWRSTTQRDLRRMWLGTFGRLPVASGLALKHRIGSSIQQTSPGRPPRMLVPPPILPGTELPPMRRWSGARTK